MANKSRGTWYVSFELRRRKRTHTRATETFPNEREAKKFARAKLVEALICRKGRSPQRRCLNGSKSRMKPVWLEPAYHRRIIRRMLDVGLSQTTA